MQAMDWTAAREGSIARVVENAAEAALRESEARYRTLAEAAHDSIFIVDRDGHIEYVNAVSCLRLQRTADTIIGRHLSEVLPQDSAEEVWRELSIAFTTKERHYFETCLDLPGGRAWLGTWCVPVHCEGTSPAAVMGVARDITDRKQLEREFAQAQKMEAVGRLAGGVAHDFNNMLTAILGYSDILRDSLSDRPDALADIEEIRKAGERAGQLIRQLLAFSRKQDLSPEVIDVNALLLEFDKMLHRMIGEDVKVDIATDPQLRRVKVDPHQLEQVVMNLVVNARDAMPHGGDIRIATANVTLDAGFARTHAGAVPGEYVALSVRDTGCGITPDVLAHVFEPFFTTKPEGKGTGLGLSTVYGIVKQSGGYIVIESEPGHGTTITVYLPVPAEYSPQVGNISRSAAADRQNSPENVQSEAALLLH
jgi:two-component system, cell cycle sensor histidine kinase and response regulator CckA